MNSSTYNIEQVEYDYGDYVFIGNKNIYNQSNVMFHELIRRSFLREK